MHCPASQAPWAGPIGLQRLFSIFSQFAIGENGHDIHCSRESAASLPTAPCSWEQSLCVLGLSSTLNLSPRVFPSSDMCSPKHQPLHLAPELVSSRAQGWQQDGQAPAWLQTWGLPDWLGTGGMAQCTQNDWNRREWGREEASMVGFFLCLLLASRLLTCC